MLKRWTGCWRICCSLLLINPMIGNSQILSRSALIEDIRQLAGILESSHPDPYTKGGGKIAFHRRLHELMLTIPEEGMTKEEFQRLLVPFVAAVGDGHTRIHIEYEINEKRPGGIPLLFSIIEKSLYVSGVVDADDKDLLGSTLLSVENVPFKGLCERVTKLRGTDNEYGALALLAGEKFLWHKSLLAELIPEWTKAGITLELRLPSGQIIKTTFKAPVEINKPLIRYESTIPTPSTRRCEFAYDFLLDNRKVALLAVDGMGGYRENFELVGFDNPYQLDGARYYYELYHETKPPDDKSELLKGIPSVTETFKKLVIDMKNQGTETLIIDLRRNGGGNSTLAQFLVYFLFGKNDLIHYLPQKSGYEIINYSNLYFDQVQDARKKTNRIGIELNNDDYWFEELDELKPAEDIDVQKATVVLDEFYARMPSFYNEYKTEKYSKYYRPKNIFVLCSPQTYSSGYTMMKMLNEFDAPLVGTPSSQNGHAPGWILNYELTNTGLEGWVACKFYTSFSAKIKDGVYQLDHELTYNQLKEYHYDPNAEILFILDRIKP